MLPVRPESTAAALSSGFAAAPSLVSFMRIRRSLSDADATSFSSGFAAGCRRGFRRLGRTNDEDEVAIEAGRQCRLRYRQHIVFLGQFDPHLHELARGQLALGVGDLAPDRNQSAGGVDLRVDTANCAGEGHFAAADPQPHRLADLQQRKLLFGNGEIDSHRVQILQRRPRGCRTRDIGRGRFSGCPPCR